ncbi:MAG TPA: hypothetical protein VKT49_13360 [Bryobacteraceae bacterium]|nr:hypothetical protein [Bryobacteraceae bacterium]
MEAGMVENSRDTLAELSFTHQLVTLAAALECTGAKPEGASFAAAAAELRRLAEAQAEQALGAFKRCSGRE